VFEMLLPFDGILPLFQYFAICQHSVNVRLLGSEINVAVLNLKCETC